MKNLCVALAILLSSGVVSCQESKKVKAEESKKEAKSESKVPEAVKVSFQAKYPGENDPDWHLDSHGFWESHFKIDGEKYRADFNADGSWFETENSIKKDNLPEAIKKAIEKEYSDEEITEVEHVMSAAKGEFYDVEFKKKGKNMDVEFRADGTKL